MHHAKQWSSVSVIDGGMKYLEQFLESRFFHEPLP